MKQPQFKRLLNSAVNYYVDIQKRDYMEFKELIQNHNYSNGLTYFVNMSGQEVVKGKNLINFNVKKLIDELMKKSY